MYFSLNLLLKQLIIMSKQTVIICQNLNNDLHSAIQNCPHDKLFVLVDEHTRKLCLPLVSDFDCLKDAHTSELRKHHYAPSYSVLHVCQHHFPEDERQMNALMYVA